MSRDSVEEFIVRILNTLDNDHGDTGPYSIRTSSSDTEEDTEEDEEEEIVLPTSRLLSLPQSEMNRGDTGIGGLLDRVYVEIPRDDQSDYDDEHQILFPLRNLRQHYSSRMFYSLYNIVESIFDSDVYQETLDRSMETYSEELFRKREDLSLALTQRILSVQDWESLEDKKCYICFDMLETLQSVCKLPCTHVYHYECVKDAVEHQHSRCPLCRQAIPIEELPAMTQGEEKVENDDGHDIRYFHS